jgi:MFS family permease
VASPAGRRGFHRLVAATAVTNLGDGVGAVAYPWLASLVTRRPLLVALVVAAQRLPWLLVSVPAGVLADRVDRRRLIVVTDLWRGSVTLAVAAVVLLRIPVGADPATTGDTDVVLYLIVVVATVAVGCAEVIRDNAAQSLLPSLVPVGELERANGRLWIAELLANTFVGPPLGALLVGVTLAAAIAVDAVSFLVAALLVATLPGVFRASSAPGAGGTWWGEAKEGLRWLWGHELLRPLAITLGTMNLASSISAATLVLYSQDVLGGGSIGFAAITMGGAFGGVLAGVLAGSLTARLAPGRTLVLVILGCGLGAALVGVAPVWEVAMAAFVVTGFLGTTWNVVTVSLRQAIIPDHLLGRVNSVYRLLAWGAMPVGAAIGGGLVTVLSTLTDRSSALRATWFVEAGIYLLLLLVAPQRLTSRRIAEARQGAQVRS